MKNNRYLFITILSFLFIFGCAPLLKKNSPGPNNSQPPSIDTSSITTPAKTVDSTEGEKLQTLDEIDEFVGSENDLEEKPDAERSLQSIIDEALDYCQVSQGFWQKGELEKALEALDQAYALLLRVDIYNDPKFFQQKEDLRFTISKRILEIYASRNIVINGNHKAIPVTVNSHVESEIKNFTGKEKTFFIESYKRSGLYRSYMVEALKEAGLPVELSWLPLIESGFKATALSSARALGLWQFIPSTGYKFGLKRDKYIDERLDPIKATNAAVAYLKELHQIFGDWSTALAAYNCGEGRVLRLIKNQNINYLDNFWDLYEQLPVETSRYVPRYLASLHMINHPEEYGLDKIELLKPLTFDEITISRQVHLKDVAKSIQASEKDLILLNPELRYKILPEEKYTLRIPPGKGALLLAKLDKIPITYPPELAFVKHRVRRGESLSTIANRYRTSVSSIVRANNIRRRNFIVAGTVLKIPRKGYVVRSAPPPTTSQGSEEILTYTVKRGDSLWILAKRYHTTTKKIIALNSLPNTTLHIGQVLKIPGQKYQAPKEGGFKIHTVKRGESPYRIAQRHNMSLEKFLRINNLSPRSKIYPGQNLFIE